ncbi:MAG TPA: hypothetical protein VN493_07095 [Thermoanaerobaculia bacterium]|nr:hypothetical protein [Thermoanaerobaculia bacterium]
MRRIRWARRALVFLGLMLAARLDAVTGPALERGAEGVVLTRLPLVLRQEEVRRHLGTGLTTTLAFEVRTLGATRSRGGARIDIRYELWDEVWIVTRADTSGRTQRTTFPSFEQLEAWWRDLRLGVLPARSAAGPAELRLRVIPFSQSEQLDAQRWFSRTLSEGSAGSAGAVSGVLAEPSGDLFNLLLATSIGRPALLEFEWKLSVPEAKR